MNPIEEILGAAGKNHLEQLKLQRRELINHLPVFWATQEEVEIKLKSVQEERERRKIRFPAGKGRNKTLRIALNFPKMESQQNTH